MASTTAAEQSVVAANAEAPKIVLYWLEQSRSQRILWLLEELKLPYQLEIFHRDKKTKLAPPELKQIHPLGKSPVIIITPAGSTESVTIAESGLIIEYLIDHFGKNTTLEPKRWKDDKEGTVAGETTQWLRYRYFIHYAEGSLMTILLMKLVATNIEKAPVPFFIRPITNRIAGQINSSYVKPNLTTHLEFLEQQLETAPGGGGYLCGPSLTGADILLSFPLIAAKGRIDYFTKDSHPLLWQYISKLETAPGYQKAVEKIVEIEGSFSASI